MKRPIALIFLLTAGCSAPKQPTTPALGPSGPKLSTEANGPLIQAILNGNANEVQKLLKAGEDANAKHNSGRSALMMAALKGQKEIVSLLLNAGAKLEERDLQGNTALMWAAFGGSAETVRFLVSKGADVNVKSTGGDTAQLWGQDKPEVLKALKGRSDPGLNPRSG